MLAEKRDWLLELAVQEQEAWDSLPESVRADTPCFVADSLSGAYEALDSGCEYISSVLKATDDASR
jgi:hypothetical protein